MSDLFGKDGEEIKPAHVSKSTGNNEWYTPEKYTDAARLVMGGIDLDPASSFEANKTINASECFDQNDDGLLHQWSGRVWMNPPFAQPFVRLFSEKIIYHYNLGDILQACVLVNNGTETKHGQILLESCDAACFTKGRIRFLAPDKVTKNAPLQGQMILYFGDNIKSFCDVFSVFGVVMFGGKS
jgi:hypothetical protein